MAAQGGGEGEGDESSAHLSSDFVVYVESDVLATTSNSTKKKGAWIDYLHLVLVLKREMPINFWSWFNTTRHPSELFLSPLEAHVPAAQALNPPPSSKTTTPPLPPPPPHHFFGNIKSLRFFESSSSLLVEKYNAGGRFKIVYNLGCDALNRQNFNTLWLDFLVFMISSSNIDDAKYARLSGVACKPQSYAGRNLNNDHMCLELWFDHNIHYAAFVRQIASCSSDDSSVPTSCGVTAASVVADCSSNIEASADTSVFHVKCQEVTVRDSDINSNSDNDGNSCNNSISNSNNTNSNNNNTINTTINNNDSNNDDGDMKLNNNNNNNESEFEVNALASTAETTAFTPRKINFETLSARRRLSYLLQYMNVSSGLEPLKVEFESFIK